MTRVLSELLGAKEPGFRIGLRQLEDASGEPREDIRLTVELQHDLHNQLRLLNLDPLDTTGQELYNALLLRVKEDNEVLVSLLHSDDSGSNLMPSIERLISELAVPKIIFGLKSASAKRLLRAHPPKKAMKQLGYRSMESMLKHEAVGLLFAAAHITEGVQWHVSMLAAYKKLIPRDFEARPITILAPTHERWEKIAASYVTRNKQNIICFRELGTIILLPLGNRRLDGAPLAATLLTLRAINEVRSSSAYLKLHQVHQDFGYTVANIARHEPLTKASVAGVVLPWNLLQRYFARHQDAYNPDIFEPHIQADDLQWHPAEDSLAELHPRFEFWRGAAHLGLLDAHQPVSLNFLDVVLNFCNKLPYEQRIVHYVREHIWQELMLRYLRQTNLEEAVHKQLSNELVE